MYIHIVGTSVHSDWTYYQCDMEDRSLDNISMGSKSTYVNTPSKSALNAFHSNKMRMRFAQIICLVTFTTLSSGKLIVTPATFCENYFIGRFVL